MVPENHIQEAWEKVVRKYFYLHCGKFPAALKVLDYVGRTYIGKRRTRKLWIPSTFPHSLWNKVAAVQAGEILTYNSVETFNRNWNASVPWRASVPHIILAFQRESRLAVVTRRELAMNLPQNFFKVEENHAEKKI